MDLHKNPIKLNNCRVYGNSFVAVVVRVSSIFAFIEISLDVIQPVEIGIKVEF